MHNWFDMNHNKSTIWWWPEPGCLLTFGCLLSIKKKSARKKMGVGGEKGREEVAWQQHSSLKSEEAQEAGRLYFLPLHQNASVNTKIAKAMEMECRGDAGLRGQKTWKIFRKWKSTGQGLLFKQQAEPKHASARDLRAKRAERSPGRLADPHSTWTNITKPADLSDLTGGQMLLCEELSHIAARHHTQSLGMDAV